MIRSIQIKNFKAIEDVTIELGRVNCFIGADGSGKSTIFEAISEQRSSLCTQLKVSNMRSNFHVENENLKVGYPIDSSSVYYAMKDFAIFHPYVDAQRVVEIIQTVRFSDNMQALRQLYELLDCGDCRVEINSKKSTIKLIDRYTNQAYAPSHGALHTLLVAVLCLARTTPQLFAVESLDAAINPRLATRLVAQLEPWLKSASSSRQLLFTANNPASLDGLDLNNDEIRLFTVERNSEGRTGVRRVIPSEISMGSDYPLSRLWMMGNLGAV